MLELVLQQQKLLANAVRAKLYSAKVVLLGCRLEGREGVGLL